MQFGSGAFSMPANTVDELAKALELYEPWRADSKEDLVRASRFASEAYFAGETNQPHSARDAFLAKLKRTTAEA